ncbi:MAG TPA: phosphoribosyltransferase family protein [Aggregatilineales bacterium]|nr:phosphoribosyltransferase family protein [Aggregatilineales bacterium]
MADQRQTFTVEIAGLTRDLPLFEVSPGVRIAVLNILGDTELVQASARALALQIADKNPEVLLTAETKSIPLTYALSALMDLPYVVLRKTYKPYMGEAITAKTLSITTGEPQTLYLDEKDKRLLEGRQVAIVDDVISTGSTLQGMESIVKQAGATIVARAAILTEGDRAKWSDIIALGHLPVFIS